MVEQKEIRNDFSFLEDKVFGVLVFGSSVKGEKTSRSDTDICIVAPDNDSSDVLSEVYRNVDVRGKDYDVHVFEELPIHVQIRVIKNHETIIGDNVELSEYFYRFRKIWKDQRHRNTMSESEIESFLEA